MELVVRIDPKSISGSYVNQWSLRDTFFVLDEKPQDIDLRLIETNLKKITQYFKSSGINSMYICTTNQRWFELKKIAKKTRVDLIKNTKGK